MKGNHAMIVEVLFVVVMLLWFLTILPYQPLAPYTQGRVFLAFFAVLLLGIYHLPAGAARLENEDVAVLESLLGRPRHVAVLVADEVIANVRHAPREIV